MVIKEEDSLNPARGGRTVVNDLIIYQTEDGDTIIDVRIENETNWMAKKDIADFFQTSPQTLAFILKTSIKKKS